jgi:hypothetical protein
MVATIANDQRDDIEWLWLDILLGRRPMIPAALALA